MPNSFINFCYNVAGKREGMEANQAEQENAARMNRARQKREAARKRAMNIKNHNAAVRSEARRGVRRPGRDHSALFQALDQLLGNLEAKKEVVRDVIEEALRFKRRELAQLLQDYIYELEMKENQGRNDNPICRHCAILRAHSRRGCYCKGRNVG